VAARPTTGSAARPTTGSAARPTTGSATVTVTVGRCRSGGSGRTSGCSCLGRHQTAAEGGSAVLGGDSADTQNQGTCGHVGDEPPGTWSPALKSAICHSRSSAQVDPGSQ
jgi:hypothetical protein